MTRIALLTPCLADADAISNDIAGMYRVLNRAGHDVTVHANHGSHRQLCVETLDALSAVAVDPDAVLIYHYSIGWGDGFEILRGAHCKRVVKYHNVTPPEFFRGLNQEFEAVCAEGQRARQDIAQLDLDLFLSDSEFNRDDLITVGAVENRSRVVPPFHQVDRLIAQEAALDLFDKYQDGITNLLTVGRVVPNKGHAALLDAFAIYHHEYNHRSRLFIVGKDDSRLTSYTDWLHTRIRHLDLQDSVIFTGGVTEAQLKAYYLLSDVFLMTSQHEGFCVPLIEAMGLKVCIVALGKTAVTETVGNAGLVWNDADPFVLAESTHQLVEDESLHAALRSAGWERYRRQFSTDVLEEQFLAALDGVL